MPGRAGAEPNGLDTTSNVAACPEAGVSRRSLLRAAGLGLVGLLACWIAVVLYWRVVDIQPTAGHISPTSCCSLSGCCAVCCSCARLGGG